MLHVFCEEHFFDAILSLLEHTAIDVNSLDDNEQTALHLLLMEDTPVDETFLQCVQMLITKGANPLLPNANNQTAVDLAKENFGHEVVQILNEARTKMPSMGI